VNSCVIEQQKIRVRKNNRFSFIGWVDIRCLEVELRILKLAAELVPKTAWNQSLAKLLPRSVWNSIRDGVIKENGKRCQICKETEGIMNLHEIWEYDDVNHVQKLDGFILLCPMCHHVKHIGLAGILANQGKLDYNKVVQHFCVVNGCSEKDFKKHLDEAFETWRERSRHEWKQDFGEYKEFVKNEKRI
jgi:hypothetical protein